MDHWGWLVREGKMKRKGGNRVTLLGDLNENDKRSRENIGARTIGRNRAQDTHIVYFWQHFTFVCGLFGRCSLFCRFSIYFGRITFLFQTTMQHICLALVSSLCLHLIFLCNAEEGLEFPNFDGKDRVLDINERNYKKALKRYQLLCLFYHEPIPANKGLQKRFQMTELVLEVSRDSRENRVVWLEVAIISSWYNYYDAFSLEFGRLIWMNAVLHPY